MNISVCIHINMILIQVGCDGYMHPGWDKGDIPYIVSGSNLTFIQPSGNIHGSVSGSDSIIVPALDLVLVLRKCVDIPGQFSAIPSIHVTLIQEGCEGHMFPGWESENVSFAVSRLNLTLTGILGYIHGFKGSYRIMLPSVGLVLCR